MTLGQLAQELGKSASSLANTLRQVGLANRLLHESDILTGEQEIRLRNGHSKKEYNRVSSQPSRNIDYPTNSIGAWAKKLNRQLVDLINIVKMNHLTENNDLTEFTVLDEEVWKKLEINLNDSRIRLHKLATSLEVDKKTLADKLFELGLIDTPNWNQRINASLEERLRSVLSKAVDKEKALAELSASVLQKENSAGKLDSPLLDSSTVGCPEEKWSGSEAETNVENTSVGFDNPSAGQEVETAGSERDDTSPPRFTLKKLSHKLGISLVRVRHILLSLYSQFSNASLENDDTYINDEISKKLISVYKNMADQNDLNVFEREFPEDIRQRCPSAENFRKSLLGLSSITWSNLSVVDVHEHKDLVQAYQNNKYVRAKVKGVNAGGYIFHPIGNQYIELFCFYKSGPTWIDAAESQIVIGSEWLVKIAQDPIEDGNTQVLAKLTVDEYVQMITEYQCYEALVVNVNDSGANVLIDRSIPAFLPNALVSWDSTITAKKSLQVGNVIKGSVYKNEQKEWLIFNQRGASTEPWIRVKEVCPVDTVVSGHIVSRKESGLLLSVGTYQAWLPSNEISWMEKFDNCQEVQFPDDLRILVKGYDEKRKTIRVSLKELEPDPWSELDKHLPEDAIISAKIVTLTNSGALLKVGDLGFKGYLSFRDVDWIHCTNKDNFPYAPGDSITAKVTHCNKERRQLTCSIKALKSNPWMELEGETFVTGSVLTVDSEQAVVRLKSGIECVCCEKLDPSEEGNELQFEILHLNVSAQQIVISFRKQEIVKLTTLAVGNMFKEYRDLSSSDKKLVVEDNDNEGKGVYRNFTVKNISSTGRITADYAEDDEAYENGILLPNSLFIKGYPVNVIFARYILKTRFAIGETYRFHVTHRYSSMNYAVLSFDAAELLDLDNIATDDMSMLVSREGIEADVLSNISTERNIFVQWRGYFGYIPCQEVTLTEGNMPDSLQLRASKAPEHPAQMIRFVMVQAEEFDENEVQMSDRDVAKDLDSDLFDCYRDINDLPGFNPKLPDYYPLALQIRYKPEKHPELAELLFADPAYFTTQTFFLDCYRAKDENGYILTMFNNSLSIVTFCREKDDGDEIRVTSCDFGFSQSFRKNYHFGKPIRIAGGNIQFVPLHSSALPSSIQDVDIIMALLKYNQEVLPKLRALNRGNLVKRGEHYLTLQELLRMDFDREVALCSEDVIIQATEISETAGSLGGYGIEFDAVPETFSRIISMDDSNDGIQVLVKPNDKEQFEYRQPSGVLRYLDAGKWIVELYTNCDIEIEALRKLGLHIKRFPNIRHLKLQIKAIESFVYERNGLDIFSRIAQNKLNPICPPNNEDIETNPHFNLKDKTDSQANALKMALGGSQITLIQGPPGTGKSTVIVDIIRNLVKRHKKVLVCTQSVAPVEELYYKVSGRRGGKQLGAQVEIGGTPLRCAYLRDDESIEISSSVSEHRQAIKEMMLLVNRLETVNTSSTETSLESLRKVRELFGDRHGNECSEVTRKFAKDILPIYSQVMDVLDEYHTALDNENVENFASEHRTLNLEVVDVVFGTCVGVGVNPILRDLHFDTLIIDEAGKANYAESLLPMMMADEYILVGDDKQLPPYTNAELVRELAEKRRFFLEQESEDENTELPTIESIIEDIMEDVGKSLFGDLHPRLPESNQIMLSRQFRMHPEIGDFVSRLFYEGKVQSVPKAADRKLNIEGLEHPILFIDTSGLGKEARESRHGMSLYNDGEIQVIEEKLLPMLEIALDAGKTVGILSPYGAQVQRMKQRFPKLSRHIFTIDSIQGEEYDIVVFSFVRNTRSGSLNFVDDLRRLNVSFSRAKCNLIMVGHLETLQNESLHKVDRDAVVAVYNEIMHKKVELVVHRGAMQHLYDAFPPERTPLIRNLDKPYCVFENCRRLRKGQFTSIYRGKILTLYNPVLQNFSEEFQSENMYAALIGYQKGKPCTMVQPMGLWLSRQQSLNEFEFSAVIDSGNQSPIIAELTDGSLIALEVPSAMRYPKGTKVKINVRNNRFFTIKPV